MLEKIAIYAGIAVMLSIYPAIKLKKVNSLSRYQDRVSKLEHQIDEIKITEQDPAKRFVKIGKVEAKIVKVREKADETMKVLKLRAKWDYQKDLIKLKRKQVYIDSTIILEPK
jgi:uncharacterized protein YwgA